MESKLSKEAPRKSDSKVSEAAAMDEEKQLAVGNPKNEGKEEDSATTKSSTPAEISTTNAQAKDEVEIVKVNSAPSETRSSIGKTNGGTLEVSKVQTEERDSGDVGKDRGTSSGTNFGTQDLFRNNERSIGSGETFAGVQSRVLDRVEEEKKSPVNDNAYSPVKPTSSTNYSPQVVSKPSPPPKPYQTVQQSIDVQNEAIAEMLNKKKKKKKKKGEPSSTTGKKKQRRGQPVVFASSSVYNGSAVGSSANDSSASEDESSCMREKSQVSSCHNLKSQGIMLSQKDNERKRERNASASVSSASSSENGTGMSTGIGSAITSRMRQRKERKKEEEANKSSTDENRKWYQLTLRQQACLIFLVLEAFLIQNMFFIIAKYQFARYTIMVETTKKELALMDTTFNNKVNQMAYGFAGQSKNGAINDLLKLYNAGGDPTNHTDFARIRSILVGEVTQRQIEYATLVSLDRTIVVNANNDRLGEVFDPQGMVSASIANPELGQLSISALVPFSEIEMENPPLFRERQNILQPTALNHPFDTERSAIIRYTVTPVFDLDDETSLLGVLVGGDIVDGKVPITFDTVNVFESGLSTVYGYNPALFGMVPGRDNITRKMGDKYWTASSMMAYDLAWTGIFDMENNENLVDGIGYSATGNFIPEDLLDETAQKVMGSNGRVVSTYDSNAFVYAARPIPMGNYWAKTGYTAEDGLTVDQIPVGFLVRGAEMGPDEKGEILQSSFGMALIWCCLLIALFDAVCIFGSIFAFIAPLEKLAQRVLRRKKIRAHHAKSIQRKAYLIAVIILIAMCSIWPSVYFYYVFTDGMIQALELKSRQELGVASIMYKIKLEQMGFEFSGVAQNGAIRDLLDYPDDAEFQRLTDDALKAEIFAQTIEYATLVDSKMKIIWSPNNNGRVMVNGTLTATDTDGVIGDTYNPFNLVKLCLETGNRFEVTELLEWAILQNENAPQRQEKLDRTIQNSKLHPSKTEDLSLIRYSATPVYSSSIADTSAVDADGRLQSILPDGVLIAGDIVNGKTIMNERVIEVLGTGYSAIYAYGAKCEQFFLVSSVYNPHATETTSKDTDGLQETDNQVDVALSEGLARSLLNPVLRRGGKNTAWGKLPNGVTYAFSAKLVSPNEEISPTAGGTAFPLSSNMAFVVYGSPVKEMEGLIAEQQIWLGTLIGLQCVKVLVVAALCFVAYKPMFKILGTMKVYAIRTPAKDAAASAGHA